MSTREITAATNARKNKKEIRRKRSEEKLLKYLKENEDVQQNIQNLRATQT